MVVVICVVVAVCLLVLSAGGWLVRHLVLQFRENELRVADLEILSRPKPARSLVRGANWRRWIGMSLPSLLHDFSLPNLAGGHTSLSQWRGQRVALVYVQPSCPYSRQLLEYLGRQAYPDPDRYPPIVISTEGLDWMEPYLGGRFPRSQVTVQPSTDLGQLHWVLLTPSAYLVNADGVTESQLLCGYDAIVEALEIPLSSNRRAAIDTPVPDEVTVITRLENPLATTIGAGERFPAVDLPDAQGQPVRIGEGANTRQIIVTLDPACAVCHDFLVHLRDRASSVHDPSQLILVNASNLPTGQPLVEAMMETSFRLVHDPARDLMDAARLVVTPSAFVLDREGRVAAPVAVGRDESKALLDRELGRRRGPAERGRGRPAEAETPKVSVILTTRDRPGFVQVAFKCFEHQTYPNRELIVVDDGERFPVDPAAVAAIGARLVRVTTGATIGAKLNAGLEIATGVLAQKMDDDDWYAPRYIESMVQGLRDVWHDGCRPALTFKSPFLFFDVARWEIRRSPQRNAAGATYFFRRADWERHPFRDLPADEDVWFYNDQMRLGSLSIPNEVTDVFLAVRHTGSPRDRGHTWQRQMNAQPLEDFVRTRPLFERTPEQMLPPWAITFYRNLRDELRANAAEVEAFERRLRG